MKITTTIQLTKDQFLQLKKESKITGNSVSSIIRTAIEERLKTKVKEGCNAI
jgi:hypothetical protein